MINEERLEEIRAAVKRLQSLLETPVEKEDEVEE